MADGADGTARWVAAGIAVLAEGGVDRVRVEVVAERLGVTKGGFYRRFRDRRALLDAILDAWSKGRIAAIDRQTALGEACPSQRLRAVIKLFSERVSAQGMAIELAIRQWARSDRAAAAAVARVDDRRLKNVALLYRRMGLTPQDAQARAVLLYAFIFGQSLLFLEQTPRQKATLIATCSSVLVAEGGCGEAGRRDCGRRRRLQRTANGD
jgi:AcrR family transcriptional regulator